MRKMQFGAGVETPAKTSHSGYQLFKSQASAETSLDAEVTYLRERDRLRNGDQRCGGGRRIIKKKLEG